MANGGDAGADIFALIEAAETGDRDALREALVYADPDDADPTMANRTALHFAASSGHAPCVRLLLSAGATPTSLTEFGQTPAHLAAENGHAECLKLLLEACPELVNVKDTHGDVPLAAAKLYNHEECIQLLLNPPSPKLSKKSSRAQKSKAKATPVEPSKEKTPTATGPKAGKAHPTSSTK